jgi:hypothetical protein
MVHKLFYISVLVCFIYACKKKVNAPEPCPEPIPKQDSIYFVFVNRIGYKKDSIDVGSGNHRYLLGINLESGYYNFKTNKSEIYEATYSRVSGLPIKDSIIQSKYPCFINSQSNLKVLLFWNNVKYSSTGIVISRVRNLTYQLNTIGNDTVKTVGNKIVKFIWPDDTASGRYTKTLDWTPEN